jgi:4-aminobutyrate aminotransferase
LRNKRETYIDTTLYLARKKGSGYEYNRKLREETRGKGLMVGIELVRDKQKTPANAEGGKIRDFCCENGLLAGLRGIYDNILTIHPPLVVTEEELLKVVKILDSAFAQI